MKSRNGKQLMLEFRVTNRSATPEPEPQAPSPVENRLDALFDLGDRPGLLASLPDAAGHLTLARGDERAIRRELADPRSTMLPVGSSTRAVAERFPDQPSWVRIAEFPLDTSSDTYASEMRVRRALGARDFDAWRAGLAAWQPGRPRRALMLLRGLELLKDDDLFQTAIFATEAYPSCFTLRQYRAMAAVKAVRDLATRSSVESQHLARRELTFLDEGLAIDPDDVRLLRVAVVLSTEGLLGWRLFVSLCRARGPKM